MLHQKIIDTARAMAAKGLIQGTSGNVSARSRDGFLITPSGKSYDDMRPEHLVEMGFDGRHAAGKPSSEWRFHRDILAARPEFGAVVHAHPVHATALAVHGRGIGPFHYMVAIAGGHDIRCAGYATFGTQELSDLVMDAMDGRKACLMAHHGLIACGRDLDEALIIATEVEALAATYLAAQTLGEPPELSIAEIERVLAKIKAGAGYGSGPAPKLATL